MVKFEEDNADVRTAVVMTNGFEDELMPLTKDTPLGMIPLVGRPVIDYVIEHLYLMDIDDVFIVTNDTDSKVMKYLRSAKESNQRWHEKLEIKPLVFADSYSVGDVLRDIYRRGIITKNFLFFEAGAIGYFKTQEIFALHSEICAKDKSAAMTVIFEEEPYFRGSRDPTEARVVVINKNNQILVNHKIYLQTQKLEIPVQQLYCNKKLSIRKNLRDTHIALCSPSFLSLFSDNFDYQTKADFIRSILMIDDVMDANIYSYILPKQEHAMALTNIRSYATMSHDLLNFYFQPLLPKTLTYNKANELDDGCVNGPNCVFFTPIDITDTLIGDHVKIGQNVTIKQSYIFDNVVIEPNCYIENSLIAANTIISEGSKIINNCIVGYNVELAKNTIIEDSLVQNVKPEEAINIKQIGPKSYKFQLEYDNIKEDYGAEVTNVISRLSIDPFEIQYIPEIKSVENSDSDEEVEVQRVEQDDAKVFYGEVFDSLARGLEEKVSQDNMILEINSSRYAYNMSLKEVSNLTMTAIINLLDRRRNGEPFVSVISSSLPYFYPILSKYLNDEPTQVESLRAIESTITEKEESHKLTVKIVKMLYDADLLSEEAIFFWFGTLSKDSDLYKIILPLVEWLKQAEEETETSSEEE